MTTATDNEDEPPIVDFSKPNEIDDPSHLLSFGKYKGDTIEEVLRKDPELLVWYHDNIEWFTLSDDLLIKVEERAEHVRNRKSTEVRRPPVYEGPLDDWGFDGPNR